MLAIAYPVVTTLVVVGTANHSLLDAVAGAAVVAVGFRLARYLARRPAGWHLRRPDQSSASGSSTAASGRTVESRSRP
jgi:K+-transporting ATPase c subunit